MSLRQEDLFVTVICDACGERLPTTDKSPVIAYYTATVHNGWHDGTALTGFGVRCPACEGKPINRDLPHLQRAAS